MTTEDRFAFKVEWFDQSAQLVREYRLTYYPSDNTIEMVCRVLLTLNSTTQAKGACS
jgi:hypothetical protein